MAADCPRCKGLRIVTITVPCAGTWRKAALKTRVIKCPECIASDAGKPSPDAKSK